LEGEFFMRMIRVILFALLISQVVFGQSEAVKVNEFFSSGGGCDIQNAFANFMEEIKQDKESKGLVVFYAGDGKERFGNVLAQKNGVKLFAEFMNFPSERILTVILEGKTLSTQEFWIIPKDAKMPFVESFNFDWTKLVSKYHFSEACLSCEPSYPELSSRRAGFEEFSEILHQNQKYQGEVVVNTYEELEIVKQKFTKEAKLPRNRYKIRFRKVVQNNAMFHLVDFYIVPKQSKLR
jgi:hypothetical protein